MKKVIKNPFERMQKGAVLLLCVVFFMAVGCEKSNRGDIDYDIYENHNISACGVNDPLQNIKWLKEYCSNIKEKKDISPVRINLYTIIDKDEHIFQISTPSPFEYTPNNYYSTLYYRNCNGDTIFKWETVTPPGGRYDDFIKDKEYAAELFHLIKQ